MINIPLRRPAIFRSVFYRYYNSTGNKESSVGYCLSAVKKRDYDNYLCLLLLPPSTRLVAIATRALNIELSTIQDTTTEPHTAKMRIDFWRRNVEQTFKGYPSSHPVLLTLALCLQQHELSEKWFHRLIDIRERYLNSKQFMSLADAEEYGEYAVSAIFQLLLESINNQDNDLIHAADHLGKAISLVTLIRSLPYFQEQRKVILPVELCIKHSVSQEDVIRKTNGDNIGEIIYDIASQGFIHLEHTKKLIDTKKNLSNIFLPHIPCQLFLEHIQKLDFNVYDVRLNKKNWMLPLKLLYASWNK